MTEQPRHPAGAPTGGQFATTARTEGTVALAAPAIETLGISPGDAVYLSAAEAGTDILDSVEIVHEDDGGYRADAGVALNLIDAYREITGVDDTVEIEPGSDAMLAASAWLEVHAQVLEAFLQDRYDAELDGSCEEWAHQRLVFSTPLDPSTDTTDTVAARVENDTKAIQAYNESDRGTFGVPYLWAEARRHFAVWEVDVQSAQRGFLADAMTETGLTWGAATDRAAGFMPGRLDENAAGVRRFMTDNHHLVQRARTAYRELHATDWDPVRLGREVAAVRNRPEAPGRAAAFSSMPPSLRAQLVNAVNRSFDGY